jgi:hypothetical protein
VPAAADDDVIMHRDPERLGGVDDVLGDGDVGFRRRRVAGWVVVHQDQRRGAQLQRTLHHLAGVDRRMVDSAALLLLMRDQRVLAVEE